ncbi:methylthioribose kinase [Alkalihalobacillus oceani]|uniref:DUF7147 family protein n=1 Tax=Halalkalibacter oceani TaxID=1653776 RepID=UPI00203B191E|nr:methylthioribose kinase [Halalkalibacter oceani]MCM3759327.1 methylthioribose kinase [Halalkalibacter oceani]
MIQRFILLGEGYTDLYELFEIARTNRHRLERLVQLDTVISGRKKSSLVVILQPAEPGKLMPLYLSLEGVYPPEEKETERYQLFEQLSRELDAPIHRLEVKPSADFNELELYFQYVIGVLRLNRFIPPLQ